MSQEQYKNVVLICIDDLRPELRCFGVDYILSPHIDQLAAEGMRFTRHYVQAPTCGASRYALLTGCYGGHSNNALFQRADRMSAGKDVPTSLPTWFRQRGYTSVAVGKVSHHPGGLGGPDWDDPQHVEMLDSWDRQLLPVGPWKHPRGWMHGLAHGEIRGNPAEMDVFQAAVGDDSIYPDGIAVDEALRQIDLLAEAPAPFFLACGILRPHLPFGAPRKYLEPYLELQLPPIPHPEKPMGQTTWHRSGEFNRYNLWGRDPNEDPDFANETRKHYAACVSFADAQVGKIIDRLKQRKLWDQTIVVIWGDHGWHLGEHAVWGKHTLFEESLRSPLIIRAADMLHAGKSVRQVVQTVDLFPTLCELANLPVPDNIVGSTLSALLQNPDIFDVDAHAISYQANAVTIRTSQYRLIVHKDRHVELYDHSAQGETENVAPQFPSEVQRLALQMKRAIASSGIDHWLLNAKDF